MTDVAQYDFDFSPTLDLCQIRDNLYSCDMYIDMTGVPATLIRYVFNDPSA